MVTKSTFHMLFGKPKTLVGIDDNQDILILAIINIKNIPYQGIFLFKKETI